MHAMVFDRRILPALLACVLGVVEFTFATLNQHRCLAEERDSSAKSASGTTQPDSRHDMILLLPSGPVHLRAYVTDSEKSLSALRKEYLHKLRGMLDANHDGKISRQETAKHPLFTTGRRFSGNKFLESLRSEKSYTDDDLSQAVQRVAGQLMTFRQNNSLSAQDLSVFQVLDENNSGMIERVEMRTAAASLAKRDLDFDQCITFDEFLNQVDRNAANAVIDTAGSEPPDSVRTELLRDATEPTLALRPMRRYDVDRDGKLSANELGGVGERCVKLDRDGDKLIDARELTKLVDAEPDLTVSIDLAGRDGNALGLIGGQQAGDAKRMNSGVVSLSSGAMTLSIGYTHRDLLEEANRNALSAFNEIDADGNGYLDRDEIAEHQRFERYLFDAMDANGDSRVFADEMLSYVRTYTEPASTSCQVTLLDTGSGFFQILDQNTDGRISVRELRQAENNLIARCNDKHSINPSKLSKSFRINIQRGGVSLFGRVDRPEAETPTVVLQPPSGPIWFQRMDRNGDGDLIWDEFLGPRDIFHQLDHDRDGLVDAQEAAKFSK